MDHDPVDPLGAYFREQFETQKNEPLNLVEQKPEPPSKKDNSWLWIIAFIFGLVVFGKCADTESKDSSTRSISPPEAPLVYNDPEVGPDEIGPQSFQEQTQEAYRYYPGQDEYDAQQDTERKQAAISGCPRGCTQPPAGCNIKGNITVKTKEKIYHLPGDRYYVETIINSAYGERWFCIEAEAIANGWRHAEQ